MVITKIVLLFGVLENIAARHCKKRLSIFWENCKPFCTVRHVVTSLSQGLTNYIDTKAKCRHLKN
jgi:hypothetical protein